MSRGNPEAQIQRAIVEALRVVLGPGSIVHHSANEVRGGGKDARTRQALATSMGVYAGFSDLLLLQDGRVLFLEVKSATGRLSASQAAFRDDMLAQGHDWALVRSVDDAMAAIVDLGCRMRFAGELSALRGAVNREQSGGGKTPGFFMPVSASPASPALRKAARAKRAGGDS